MATHRDTSYSPSPIISLYAPHGDANHGLVEDRVIGNGVETHFSLSSSSSSSSSSSYVSASSSSSSHALSRSSSSSSSSASSSSSSSYSTTSYESDSDDSEERDDVSPHNNTSNGRPNARQKSCTITVVSDVGNSYKNTTFTPISSNWLLCLVQDARAHIFALMNRRKDSQSPIQPLLSMNTPLPKSMGVPARTHTTTISTERDVSPARQRITIQPSQHGRTRLERAALKNTAARHDDSSSASTSTPLSIMEAKTLMHTSNNGIGSCPDDVLDSHDTTTMLLYESRFAHLIADLAARVYDCLTNTRTQVPRDEDMFSWNADTRAAYNMTLGDGHGSLGLSPFHQVGGAHYAAKSTRACAMQWTCESNRAYAPYSHTHRYNTDEHDQENCNDHGGHTHHGVHMDDGHDLHCQQSYSMDEAQDMLHRVFSNVHDDLQDKYLHSIEFEQTYWQDHVYHAHMQMMVQLIDWLFPQVFGKRRSSAHGAGEFDWSEISTGKCVLLAPHQSVHTPHNDTNASCPFTYHDAIERIEHDMSCTYSKIQCKARHGILPYPDHATPWVKLFTSLSMASTYQVRADLIHRGITASKLVALVDSWCCYRLLLDDGGKPVLPHAALFGIAGRTMDSPHAYADLSGVNAPHSVLYLNYWKEAIQVTPAYGTTLTSVSVYPHNRSIVLAQLGDSQVMHIRCNKLFLASWLLQCALRATSQKIHQYERLQQYGRIDVSKLDALVQRERILKTLYQMYRNRWVQDGFAKSKTDVDDRHAPLYAPTLNPQLSNTATSSHTSNPVLVFEPIARFCTQVQPWPNPPVTHMQHPSRDLPTKTHPRHIRRASHPDLPRMAPKSTHALASTTTRLAYQKRSLAHEFCTRVRITDQSRVNIYASRARHVSRARYECGKRHLTVKFRSMTHESNPISTPSPKPARRTTKKHYSSDRGDTHNSQSSPGCRGLKRPIDLHCHLSVSRCWGHYWSWHRYVPNYVNTTPEITTASNVNVGDVILMGTDGIFDWRAVSPSNVMDIFVATWLEMCLQSLPALMDKYVPDAPILEQPNGVRREWSKFVYSDDNMFITYADHLVKHANATPRVDASISDDLDYFLDTDIMDAHVDSVRQTLSNAYNHNDENMSKMLGMLCTTCISRVRDKQSKLDLRLDNATLVATLMAQPPSHS